MIVEWNKNKYEDNGSPCRRPLVGKKVALGLPFTRTEQLTIVMQDMINSIHLVHNSKAFIVEVKYGYLTWL